MFLLILLHCGILMTWGTNLHSTMFLLIHFIMIHCGQDIANLHSTMFLLIPDGENFYSYWIPYLHSTMFLLIPSNAPAFRRDQHIYIPLCFYLYDICKQTPLPLLLIYIPLCFYLYHSSLQQSYMWLPYLHSTMFLLIRLISDRYHQ